MPKEVHQFHLFATEAVHVHCKIVYFPNKKPSRNDLCSLENMLYLGSDTVSLSLVFDGGMGLSHHFVAVIKDLP